jgi:DNA-binding NtrC family response regulator
MLAEHFIKAAARRMNTRAPKILAPMLRMLTAHHWPGNVRELQNVMERAVILSQGGPLQFESLGTAFLPTGVPALRMSPRMSEADNTSQTLPADSVLTRAELKQREAKNITAALQQTGGKVFGAGGAAELLGMKPTTLASRIKALGLQKKDLV